MPLSGGNREVHLPADRNPEEVFQEAITGHGFEPEHVATALQGNALFEEPCPGMRRVEMRRFLSDHVVNHFAFKEREVFRALRTGSNAAVCRLVGELFAEHEALLVRSARCRGCSVVPIRPAGRADGCRLNRSPVASSGPCSATR